MAMWITKDRATQGPVFGSKDNFEGLGIFFDTYKNNRPGTVFPFVMAMLGDGKTSYSKETDGKDQELGSCSVRDATPNAACAYFLADQLCRHAGYAARMYQPRRA